MKQLFVFILFLTGIFAQGANDIVLTANPQSITWRLQGTNYVAQFVSGGGDLGTWTQIEDPGGHAFSFAATVYNASDEKLYILPAIGQPGYCFTFDGVNLVSIADAPQNGNYSAAGYYNGHVYQIGGDNGDGTNVYWYDPSGDLWNEVNGLPSGIRMPGVAVANGYLYVFGGCQPHSGTPNTSSYKFDGSDWTPITSPPVYGWNDHMNVGGDLNGFIYSIGGNSVTNVYRYNTVGDYWDEVEGLPAATIGQFGWSASKINNKLYVIGGTYLSWHTNLYCFDGTHWTEKLGCPVPVAYCVEGSIGNKLYVSGDATGSTNTFYWTP